MHKHFSFWQVIWKQFCKHKLGVFALAVVFLYILVSIYAPLLASSKPLMVKFEGQFYFPLFRYLFYSGFFTKGLDLFYNLLMFTFPLFLVAAFMTRKWLLGGVGIMQVLIFLYFIFFPLGDPARGQLSSSMHFSDWQKELEHLTPYAKLNQVLRYQQYREQQKKLQIYEKEYADWTARLGQSKILFPSLWNLTYALEAKEKYQNDRHQWLAEQVSQLSWQVMPLIRPFHWEDDAGGDQGLNRFVSWWDLTRINRKDMVSSLIFGVRISLSVGLLAIGLALLIGVPIGAVAGYYGGKFDLIVYRLIEIWESMPTFFMLLMIVAFLQTKSIFLVIFVIGLFGWTSFSRFIRGEFFRQKQLLYVEACHAMGYGDRRIIFSHLLPNAIPPLLTLIPFAIMGAITSEAGLSFLGLGEEGSNSWGVLMDEGRTAFPAESYLLWPPAILLTILLVSIALVGDNLRDALDPKLHT